MHIRASSVSISASTAYCQCYFCDDDSLVAVTRVVASLPSSYNDNSSMSRGRSGGISGSTKNNDIVCSSSSSSTAAGVGVVVVAVVVVAVEAAPAAVVGC